MPYDVGKITKDIQQRFRLFSPPGTPHKEVEELMESEKNKATPGNIRILLAALSKVTTATMAARTEWGLITDAGVDSWDHDLDKWRTRLADYQALAEAAPLGDREAILWDVTAPLLLGFYGGPESKLPQQTLDAATPFILANGIDVAEEWREERWRLFVQDIKDNAKDLAINIGWIAAVAIGGALGVTLLFSLARGRR